MLTHIQIHNMSLLLSIYLYIHTTIHPFSSLTLSLYCIHTCMLSICQCFSQSIHLVIVLSIFSLIVVVGTPAVRMLVVRIAVYVTGFAKRDHFCQKQKFQYGQKK